MADEAQPALKPARQAHTRAQFVQWLLLPDTVRKAHGLPTTYAEWAKAHKTTTRTMRRWKEDPSFDRLLEEERAKLDPSNTTPSVRKPKDPVKLEAEERAKASGAEEGSDLYDLHLMRADLKRRALMGDTRAAETWFKLFGQEAIAAERRETTSLFPELDDDELIVRTLAMVGPERVSDWLAGLVAA